VLRTPVGLTHDEAGAVLRELRSQFKSIRAVNLDGQFMILNWKQLIAGAYWKH
jgi:hypothetical protein